MRNGCIVISMLCCVVFFSISSDALSQEESVQWRFTSSMVIPRFEAAATYYDNYLYVFGGHGEWAKAPYASVERAPIGLEDGSLGMWLVESDTLPLPVYGATTVAKNGYVYVVAGNPVPYYPTTIVQYAEVGVDGSLQDWQQTSALNQQRVNHAGAEYNGYIYVMGGNAAKGLSSVEYAPINPDGTLGTWTVTSELNLGRWLASGIAHNGYVYVAGGYMSETSVEYAQANPDGSLGEWNHASSLMIARSGAPGLAVMYGYLFAFAGDNGSGANNTVEKSLINPDGSLSAWSVVEDTLMTRVNLTAFAHGNGHVYLLGGSNFGIPTDDVQMSSLVLPCGDSDCSGDVDIDDVVYLINYIFSGGSAPCEGCK